MMVDTSGLNFKSKSNDLTGAVFENLKTSGSKPSERYGSDMVEYNNNLIMFGGGYDNVIDDSKLYNLNLDTLEWSYILIKGAFPPARIPHYGDFSEQDFPLRRKE